MAEVKKDLHVSQSLQNTVSCGGEQAHSPGVQRMRYVHLPLNSMSSLAQHNGQISSHIWGRSLFTHVRAR